MLAFAGRVLAAELAPGSGTAVELMQHVQQLDALHRVLSLIAKQLCTLHAQQCSLMCTPRHGGVHAGARVQCLIVLLIVTGKEAQMLRPESSHIEITECCGLAAVVGTTGASGSTGLYIMQIMYRWQQRAALPGIRPVYILTSHNATAVLHPMAPRLHLAGGAAP
jgi:hypothetical protein